MLIDLTNKQTHTHLTKTNYLKSFNKIKRKRHMESGRAHVRHYIPRLLKMPSSKFLTQNPRPDYCRGKMLLCKHFKIHMKHKVMKYM